MHQSILYIKRKLWERRTHKCNSYFGAKSPLRSTGLQLTWFYTAPYRADSFHAAAYRADSADLPKIGASFNHGTVIAPMHSLYQMEATGMENPKMQSLYRCKKHTSQYGSAKYPVLYSAVQVQQCRFEDILGYLSPRCRDCTNAFFISKTNYGNGEPKNVILALVQKAHFAYKSAKYPISCSAV